MPRVCIAAAAALLLSGCVSKSAPAWRPDDREVQSLAEQFGGAHPLTYVGKDRHDPATAHHHYSAAGANHPCDIQQAEIWRGADGLTTVRFFRLPCDDARRARLTEAFTCAAVDPAVLASAGLRAEDCTAKPGLLFEGVGAEYDPRALYIGGHLTFTGSDQGLFLTLGEIGGQVFVHSVALEGAGGKNAKSE